MNTRKTDITAILDKSGSMADRTGITISGFNEFLNDQKRAPGEANITLYLFNDFHIKHDTQPVAYAKRLDAFNYRPGGNTALLDTLGTAISETGARLAALPERERPGKVVVLVMTDGLENASHLFSRARIVEMINHQRDKYQWEFVFLGANIDAIAEAGAIGVAAVCAMTVTNNDTGYREAYRAASSNLRQMRAGTKADMSFEPDQYAAQLAAAQEEEKEV